MWPQAKPTAPLLPEQELYFDGHHPGRLQSPDHKRKQIEWYFSFLIKTKKRKNEPFSGFSFWAQNNFFLVLLVCLSRPRSVFSVRFLGKTQAETDRYGNFHPGSVFILDGKTRAVDINDL